MSIGVNLFGYSRAESGVGESCRLAANSMESVHIPFGIVNYPICTARKEDLTWVTKEIKEPIFNTNIFHINADQLESAFRYNIIKRQFFKNRYNIAVWHWELSEFPDEFSESFKIIDEVWVPSTFIFDSIFKKSPVPVVRIPHGLNTNPPYKIIGRKHFLLPDHQFLFLMMYDPNSFQNRKNPHGVISSFKLAFEKDDFSVGLIIKINNNQIGKSIDLENLKKQIDGYKNIYIIDKVINRNEVNALIKIIDCLVSLHRSEGFGLPLAEAMVLGKPVIATGWSGNMDFMNKNNSCLVRYQLTKIGDDWGPYKAEQVWAEPDIEHAAYYMRKMIENPYWRKKIALKGKETIRKYFSSIKSGELMKARLNELKLL
ncbi:glycosyltransferase family 4 protein [Priestia aryabhattai]|uniref:glycosyltransferase family 4 protein n=1 Tax=Priestia TaxID=2800373 RepID=UPI001C8F0CDD|nr:glycosyltransferase family 4 protein [Priestia aryabhattai]MBY0074706.1 glycosyltransferase family 4 protein [Priestia aryabhattai]